MEFLSKMRRSQNPVPTFLALVGVVWGVLPALAGDGPSPEAIRWRTRALAPPAAAEGKHSNRLDARGRGDSVEAGEHVVVQLDRTPTRADRRVLEAAGVRLLRYLGTNAYFARLAAGQDAVLAAEAAGVSSISSAFPIDTAWKLHPMLQRGDFPEYARVRGQAGEGRVGPKGRTAKPVGKVDTVALYAVFHRDVALDPDGVATVKRHGGVIRSYMRSINGAVVWLPLDSLQALAEEDVVEWLEPPLPPMEGTNDSSRSMAQADALQALPYDLDGSGISVLVYDAGYALSSHSDFGTRLTARDSSTLSSHATHVAGTIGGDGSAGGGQYAGMAPAVTMQSYGFETDGGLEAGFLYTDPGDLEADYDQAINTYGVVIANNSIGSNLNTNGYPCEWEGDYGATAMLIDEIVRGSLGDPVRIIWANGNERQGSARCGSTYRTTAPPAGAKNHITVGAVNSDDATMTSFSSWGPTDDGRLKPDVCAPGCQASDDFGVTSCSSAGGYTTLCGTSMAAPALSGLSALLLQDFKVRYPGRPLPRNSTLKVLWAHNALDLGNAGPDYMYGYGLVQGQATIDFMRAGSFVEDSLEQGEDRFYIVRVPAGASSLKVTIAWDDPAGAANTLPELVNDLDLIAVSPASAATYYPWTLDPDNPGATAVRAQADRLNNIEQVVVDNPEEGTWMIRVSGQSVPQGPQVFSIAATPDMLICSSEGVITLDADEYTCGANVAVWVNDCDLNADPELVETVTVTVSSTSESGGESVLLTETKDNSATFVGTISIFEVDSTGVLQVADGDLVTAHYDDADVGDGNPATVQDTAVVDCVPPVVSNVTADVAAVRATITFDTDEPTRSTLRHGLSCQALDQTARELDLSIPHGITLTGLRPDTPYFFVIDAEDAAGNSTRAPEGGGCLTFTTLEAQDYFTEEFSAADNDLDNRILRLVPDGSLHYYRACGNPITALRTDPAGGTQIPLSDDASAARTLSDGKTVELYGAQYDTFYVGSNGYITFGSGDNVYTPSLDAHFGLPRISALFRDLNPSTAGAAVSWKQLGDRVAVTWQNVPRFNGSDSNTFQIEMYFDGKITIAWLGIDVIDGVAGVSEGSGVGEDFGESDLTGYVSCSPADFDRDDDVDMEDFGHLQACFSGSGVVQAEPACADTLLDGDNDVDQDDLTLFRQCMSGPGVAPDPACMD